MTDKDLMKAMSEIRDEYILEAAPDQVSSKVVPIWKRRSFRAVSGVVAASVILVLGINTFQNNSVTQKNDSAVNTAMEDAAEAEKAPEKEMETETEEETETETENKK